VRGFINYEFAEQHYAEFLREVGDGIADGRIRYREDLLMAWRTHQKRSSACWRGATSAS